MTIVKGYQSVVVKWSAFYPASFEAEAKASCSGSDHRAVEVVKTHTQDWECSSVVRHWPGECKVRGSNLSIGKTKRDRCAHCSLRKSVLCLPVPCLPCK